MEEEDQNQDGNSPTTLLSGPSTNVQRVGAHINVNINL